jgi:hypothetical protein
MQFGMTSPPPQVPGFGIASSRIETSISTNTTA